MLPRSGSSVKVSNRRISPALVMTLVDPVSLKTGAPRPRILTTCFIPSLRNWCGDISLEQMRIQKVGYLPRNLSTSALYNGCDETRFVPCERVTEDLVRQLIETCRCRVPCVTSRQVLSEMAQSKLELDFCRRSLPRAQQRRERLPLRC